MVLVDGVVRAAGSTGAVFRAPSDRMVAELLGYTVLPCDAGLIAVPPGGLHLGGRALAFPLRVERVVDLGNHPHLVGRVGDVRVDVRLAVGDPVASPGEVVQVGAASWVALRRP